jgi:N-carbamoyl-L-amino-acid hydrolase
MSVEMRDLDPRKLAAMMEDIRARARDIASTTGTTIAFRELARAAPAVATPDVQAAIERATERLTLGSTRLPSGAGHDAQMMALLGPMGMIFVPSAGGVSHSPKELTRWDDCTRGADVLLHTLLEVDGLG